MMDTSAIRLLAFDMDGTLTQHKTHLTQEARDTLTALGEKYHLVMVGAGTCSRIYEQLEHFPIDIIGNYGLQEAEYRGGELHLLRDEVLPCDRESVEKRVTGLRDRHQLYPYAGDNVEYHPSGCVTIPCLGTKAVQADKLAYDPDRKKRRAYYREVVELFPDYIVFVGGSSSFDMAPAPYNKAYALKLYCDRLGYTPDQVLYFGDDYGPGGNDESVFQSEFGFVKIDDYRTFPAIARGMLL